MVVQTREGIAAESPSWAQFSLAGHLLALSIVGVLLKQLRLIGDSLGPFEVVGLVVALALILSNRARPDEAAIYFSRFLALLTLAFCCGAATSAIFFPEHLSLREVIAMLYVAVLVFGWISFTEKEPADRVGLLRDYIAVYCGATVVIAVFGYPLSSFLWYFDVHFGRLMGLSDNPNQLAGISTAGFALCLLRASMLRRLAPREIVSMGFIILAGTLSQSVTFILSVIVSALAVVALHVLFTVRPESAMQRAISFALLMGFFTIIGVVVLFGGQILGGLEALWSGGSAKGATRLAYWLLALEEALWSPLVGLGPGGHVRASHTDVLQEAHNIFIELFLSGGLLALGLYMFAVIMIGVVAFRQRRSLVLGALLAMLIMGSFHTVLRHAHYWIVFHAMLSALMASQPSRARPNL